MPRQALLRTTVVALVAVLAVSGCASSGSGKKNRKSGAKTSAAKGSGYAGSGTTGSGSTGAGSGSSGGQSGTTSTTSTPKPAGPTIEYFRVARKPSCPAGTSANPVAGTPVVLEWRSRHVDSVALSVDGPGVYGDNYPAAGSETLNFPCSGSEGDVQKHTYLLTVRNAYGKRTKTLVVSATVHDVPQV
ncbi:hypothetical protein ABGB16_02285 [Micromonospora sp. B11E3]|uniref:hypothetical protein n=1 Tax=Micromonospora sp. B11E3 TaxID=3153562 RepID=UPI00325C77F0